MGGTIRRLVEQKHDVHVAYETSGNIAVGDEEVIRFLHFINGFNQIFNNSEDKVVVDKYAEIRKFLKEKKDGDIDTRDILTIKGLIRRGEARTACTYNNIPLDHCHFLDLPFYETGRIQKGPLTEADVEIVRNLLREVKPHQIFVAGDLADPHGTHRVCTDAVFAAIDLEKEEGAKWLKDCRIWMYRGAWAEWEIENIEMAVPISPEELRAKRNSILKHQSQMHHSWVTTNVCSGNVVKTVIVVPPHCMTISVWHLTRQWKHSWNIFRCKCLLNRKKKVAMFCHCNLFLFYIFINFIFTSSPSHQYFLHNYDFVPQVIQRTWQQFLYIRLRAI